MPGEIIAVDFPGITGTKRRPVVVLSSERYHQLRPDIIVGLLTSQTKNLGATDYELKDWSKSGLRVASIFRSFVVTLQRPDRLQRIGTLSKRDWEGICSCLSIALGGLEVTLD